MSESLRDLVVSLSLQTDNFTRNIKSVNKQIQEAESQFRLAAAGLENFENSAAGLSTKLTTLNRRLELQENIVAQYSRALDAASDKLVECSARERDYSQRLVRAKDAQQALKEQVAAAAEQVKYFSRTLGTSDSATIAAQANLDQLKGDERYVMVSLDADLYEPTRQGLKYFYPRLVKGGVIVIHDYNSAQFEGVRKAVREYCEENGLIPVPLCDLHGTAVLVKQ